MRWIYVMLFAALMAMGACGNKPAAETTEPTATETPAEPAAETPAETPAATDEAAPVEGTEAAPAEPPAEGTTEGGN